VTDDLAIRARGVSKCYRVFDSERARLLHALWPAHRDGMQEIPALEDISFEVKRGESFGVIGRNGGGKSTLLQILTGVLRPTAGEVEVNGRVSALLELGSGFNPEYTGRDNVILNGMLLGLGRDEILARFDEIAAFADIGEAIERPVKTYSSGMVLRLAYAVQALIEPDILVIDEALSVGDFFFQQKCFGHLRALRAKGVTVVFVSHDMGTVRDLCERAIYLKRGRVQFAGPSQAAIREYLAEPYALDMPPSRFDAPLAPTPALSSFLADCIWKASGSPGDQAVALIGVAFYDAAGNPATSFRIGDSLNIRAAFRSADGEAPHVAVTLRNKFDQVVTSSGSSRLRVVPPQVESGAVVVFDISLDLMVEAGNYSVTVTLARTTLPNRGSVLDSTPSLGPIAVKWDYEREEASFLGMVGLPAKGGYRLLDTSKSTAM
jgi:lipopolysaccharide transport system ATP-binding protein